MNDNIYTDAAQHDAVIAARAKERLAQIMPDTTQKADERFMAWRQLAQAERRIAELEEELRITDRLLEERQRVLDAIPPCPDHGSCVPYALEWVENAKRAIDVLTHEAQARLAALEGQG